MSPGRRVGKKWFLYILRCADGTLYTGISTDVARRLARHRSGRGARYTRTRRPLELVWSQAARSEGDARRREAAIKRWNKKNKEALVRRGGES